MLFVSDTNVRSSQWPQKLWHVNLSKVVCQNPSFYKINGLILSNAVLLEYVGKAQHNLLYALDCERRYYC